jgi:hypothetical protein
MKTKSLTPLMAAIVATLLISITSGQGQALAEEKAWTLQERTLPAPAAASEALRDAIANAPQPDVARSQGTTFKTMQATVQTHPNDVAYKQEG